MYDMEMMRAGGRPNLFDDKAAKAVRHKDYRAVSFLNAISC